jgi:hypothetical protein
MVPQIGGQQNEPTKDEQLRVAALNFANAARKERPFDSIHEFLTWASETEDYIKRGEFKGKGGRDPRAAEADQGKEDVKQ